jgi:hypothetical protein
LSPDKWLSEYFFLHPEEVKGSIYIFENPLYNVLASSPRISMATFGGGGGGGQGPPPPPMIFAKVDAIYAPLVLPVPLHDLPQNYMKNLPSFIGEGELIVVEHINFFDQFTYILGLEHEDIYSQFFVQNFEGKVRTWFPSLPAGSILSYDALENPFLRQWGERKDHLYYLTEFGDLRKKNQKLLLNSSKDLINYITRSQSKLILPSLQQR